jgi:RHS repeat-associated protein
MNADARPRTGRGLAATAALVLSALVVQLVAVVGPSAVAAPGSLVSWNVRDLPALSQSDTTGPRGLPLEGVVVTLGASSVSTSTVPTLKLRVNAQGRDLRFRILDPVDLRVIEESAAVRVVGGVGRWSVPRGVLADRVTYLVSVVDALRRDQVVLQPTALTVDTQRPDTQQLHTFSGVSVSLVTGEPVINWASAGAPTLTGPAGFSLMYRPSNPTQPGLPAGWAMHAAGATSRWTSLEISGRGRQAVLTQSDGWTVAFVRSGEGLFLPLLGAHHSWPGGVEADLYANEDGTYTVVDANQAVTTFPTAGAAPLPVTAVQLEPSRSWVDGSPSLQSTWSDDRLTSLDDPVSGRSVVFTYAPSGLCGSPAEGFVAAPNGMLCQVGDWAGHITRLSYVAVDGGVQVGRITGRPDQGQHAQATDVAWDRSGRFAAARQPLAAAAIAAGVVDGLGPQDPRALTQLGYDSAGRVNTIIAPAGLVSGATQTLAQETRPTQRLEYRADLQPDSGRMVTRVIQDGLAVPILLESTADLATMDRLSEKGPNGCGRTFKFSPEDNATETVNTCDGTRMKVDYDAQGQPVREIGPSRFPMTPGSGAPVSVTRYDTEPVPGRPISSEGTPLLGMVMLGYDGSSLSGVPSHRSVGPLVDGRAPASMRFGWGSNPSGNGGQWSARMSGEYISDHEGTYRFTATTPVQMWVNGQSCDGLGCKFELRRDQVVDLRVAFTSTDVGRASFDLLVSRDRGVAVPIPSARLRPALNLTTEMESFDQLGAGRPRTLTKTFFTYDHQTGERLSGQTSAQGTTVSYGWAPNTGLGSNHGQRVSVTNPAGRTAYDEFYEGSESATASGCTASAANQGGLLKSTTRDGAATSTQVYNDAGQTVLAGGAGTQTCITYGEAGQPESGLVSGPGGDYGQSREEMVGGNPLVTSGTVTSRGVVRTMRNSVSITGLLFQATDSWGTTTTLALDPQTKHVTSSLEVTAEGESRTTTFTYNSLGQQTSVAVDGNVLVRNTYTRQGGLASSDYANGTRATWDINRNNVITGIVYSGFSGGVTTRESRVMSDQGAVLSRTLFGPEGFSQFRYAYNEDHRLVSSNVEGSIPVSTTSTTVDFSGPLGANGNRRAETVTPSNGAATTWSYEYGPDDRLISSTKPALSSVPTYDAAGRTLTTGETALTYDAGGNLVEAASPTGTVAFGGDGSVNLRRGTSDVTVRRSGNMLLDADGRIEGQIVALAGGVVVAIDAAGAPLRWQYPDLQGSVAWQTSGNAAPSTTTVYDPWGQQISAMVEPVIAESADLELAMLASWSGSVRLPNTDDAYLIGARQYSPASGRFLQPDPVNGGSLNTYEYANGDPINFGDPSGGMSLGKVIGMVVGFVVSSAIIAVTKGAGAPLAAMVLKGMFAGAVGTLAGSLVEHGIDDGFATPLNWEAAGIKMAVGAGFGGIKGGIKSTLMSAKIAAVQTKIDTASTAFSDAFDAAEAAEKKFTTALGTGDLAEINPANNLLEQTKGLAAGLNGQITFLESELANVGLSWPQFFALELGIPGAKYLVNTGIEAGGYYDAKPDPGTTSEGAIDPSAAGASLLRSVFAE